MMHHHFSKVSNCCAVFAGLFALAALMGYAVGNLLWASILARYIPMAPSTALSFLMLNSVLLLPRGSQKPLLQSIRTAMTLLVAVYGLLIFAYWIFGQSVSFEAYFIPDMGDLKGIPIGRMAPMTGALFLLSGLGILCFELSTFQRPKNQRAWVFWQNVAGWLGISVVFVTGTFLLGYFYGTPLLYAGESIPLAATTVIAFLLLGIAQIAVLGPEASPARHFVGPNTSAQLLRVFIPLIIGAILLQSMLSHFIPVLFGMNMAITIAIVAAVVLLFAVLITGRVARHLGNIIDATEEQLKGAREEFRTMLYSIGDGLITTDKDGYIHHMNPVAETLTGWPQADAKGRPLEQVFHIIHEENRNQLKLPSAEVLQQGKITDLASQAILISRDGREYPIADSGAPIRNKEDAIQGMVLVFRDQSKERQAEQSLRASEKQYRYLFHANPHPMWVYDMETLAFLEVNQAAVEHYGYSTVEFLHMRITDIRPEEDIPRLLESTNRFGETDIDHAGVWRHLRKDGSMIYVEITSHVLTYNGRPAELVLVNDVTERFKAERELQETKNLLENILDNLGDALFIIKIPERTIEYCNPAALRMFGYEAQEMIGQSTELIHVDAESYQHFDEIGLPILEREPLFRAEYDMKHKDGSIINADITVTPLQQETGSQSRVISILHDITARKRAEAEREKLEAQLLKAQKMDAIGRLAGGIAHDYNNMLGVILGHVEIALMDMTEENSLKEDLLAIQSAAQRSSNLTRQLLAFARRQEINPECINLNEAIANMQKLLSRLIGENVELHFQPGEEGSPSAPQSTSLWPVKMDPSQIDQILFNLTINARDAIQGAGKISISTRNVELDEEYCKMHVDFMPGAYVMLELSDTGCGMDKEVQSHIFEPFYTTKSVGKGTGLGLATIYGIVKQNQGHIHVYSEPGHGCTFRIYIPAHIPKEKDVEKKHSPLSGIDDLPHGTETVLLVEDEETLLKLGARMLEQLGYTVLPANHPQQALELAETHRDSLQLLITDVVMPDMSGQELWNQLHNRNPNLRCLFMSGYTADIISEHGILHEGLHFIQKPFPRSALAYKIREVMDKSIQE